MHLDTYGYLKAQQVSWARSQGIGDGQTETDRPWVLKAEYRTLNLWDPSWWTLIAGKEHRWASALTSSQCFAVNLFAPLALDQSLAGRVLPSLLPQRVLATSDRVEVALELTPANGPQWLGERRRQPTQVDAAFIVRRHGRPIGYLLVEVKLGERRFGSCRGARKPSPSSSSNPDPDRCRSLVQILAQPESQCWLAETQGRRYWRYLREETGPFRFEHLPPDAPCPFSGGLYQLMRNRVLAHALVREGGADWADVGLCIHPANNAVDVLEETVGGERSAQEAFRSILRPDDRLVDLAPRAVIDAVLAASPQMSAWAGWVRDRYQL